MNRDEFFKKVAHNEKLRSFLQRGIFGRAILTFFILFLQILFIILFCARLTSYTEVYFISSIMLSCIFIIFLSNTKGKNEFKIAWILPIIVLPLFGVTVYFLYHINFGSLTIRHEIKKIRLDSKKYIESEKKVEKSLEKFSEVKDIANYLYKSGDFAPSENNRITYYSCGEKFYPELCKEISKAKKFVFLEFFIINLDESWDLIIELLEKKVKEGVEVRIIFDGFGSLVSSYSGYQKYLAEKGFKTFVVAPIIPILTTGQNNRDHRKIVVIDGKVAFTGGVNIKNEYFNYGKNRFPYWKDNAIKLEGSSVNSFSKMFLQLWNAGKKTSEDFNPYFSIHSKKKDCENLVIPYDDNAFNNEDFAENVYLYLINNAKKYIHITSPYLLLDNSMKEALIFAAKRGVEVSIMLPSQPDHILTFCVGKTFLPELLENGINIYIYQKGFLHAKTFICDDKMATIGSINLDYRSLYHHFECAAFIYDKNLVPQIENDFFESEKDCLKMQISDYKKIPLHCRAYGRIFRIFAPLL